MKRSFVFALLAALPLFVAQAAPRPPKDQEIGNGGGDAAFSGLTSESLGQGVDDCSATTILDRAITRAGVNPITGPVAKTWSCRCVDGKPSCDGGMPESRYVLNGCRSDESMTCYANSPMLALCISRPRLAKVEKFYGRGVGKVIDIRARFDRIAVVSKTAGGFSEEKVWTMDKQGCEPAGDAFAECKAKIKAYLTGGPLFPPDPISPNAKEPRYCDKSGTQDHVNAIEELNGCLEAYPSLGYSKNIR